MKNKLLGLVFCSMIGCGVMNQAVAVWSSASEDRAQQCENFCENLKPFGPCKYAWKGVSPTCVDCEKKGVGTIILNKDCSNYKSVEMISPAN